MPPSLYTESERLRRIHRVLVMLYQEKRSQAEIAVEMGISPATINRMIREGHERGMIEIRIRAPFGAEAGLTVSLQRLGRLDNAVAVHAPSSDPAIVLKAVADAAATALLDRLRDGMTVAVSGGVALCAVIEALAPARKYDVRVVPATGGVQGKFRTDVNHVAVALAEKLGGTAYQLHAPVFAATVEERTALMSVSTISSVLDIARGADVALFGIGSVRDEDSTYLTLTDAVDPAAIERAGAEGELLAHLVTIAGAPCDHPSNRRLVSLTLDELARIPLRIAVASGAKKVGPIAAVLRGGVVGSLITDDATARAVVEKMEGGANAATA
jgi:DNA-binding transcriptional regulator LsrR (DeoR family)